MFALTPVISKRRGCDRARRRCARRCRSDRSVRTVARPAAGCRSSCRERRRTRGSQAGQQVAERRECPAEGCARRHAGSARQDRASTARCVPVGGRGGAQGQSLRVSRSGQDLAVRLSPASCRHVEEGRYPADRNGARSHCCIQPSQRAGRGTGLHDQHAFARIADACRPGPVGRDAAPARRRDRGHAASSATSTSNRRSSRTTDGCGPI